MVTDERLILWVLTPSGEIHVETVPVARRDLEGSVQELADLLSFSHSARRGARPLDNSGSPSARQTQILRRLYQLLIEPVERHLPREMQPARILFVPHGPLFRVPFPALVDATGQPLLLRYILSTAPALGALESIYPPGAGRWASQDVLVAGNPVLPRAFAGLADLGGAAREAAGIAQRFGARPLLGTAATKEADVAAMPQARLIHLAGHSLLEHGEEKDFPGALVFASTAGDDLLTAREIAKLKLSADLVVLSACDTGGGHITGDGVVGLARSFLAAGAKGVVVSLWKVDDQATAFLMDTFYEHLARGGGGRADALRQAMLAARGRYPDPRRWAAFTFIGVELEGGEGPR
jgi:CHAT domain-containing protein